MQAIARIRTGSDAQQVEDGTEGPRWYNDKTMII